MFFLKGVMIRSGTDTKRQRFELIMCGHKTRRELSEGKHRDIVTGSMAL